MRHLSRASRILLPRPAHDRRKLPAIRINHSTRISRAQDSQIVQEFRSKLKVAEDLISKLAFSLREIQGMRRRPKATSKKVAKSLPILRLLNQSGGETK